MLDLYSPLKVVSWASAHANCPMRYTISSADDMVITFGTGPTEFEFSLDAGALHTLVQLGTKALNEMGAYDEEPHQTADTSDPGDSGVGDLLQ